MTRAPAACLLIVAAAAAPAAAEPFPDGRISGVLSGRNGTGGLADELGRGWGFGVEAGFYPMDDEQRVGWGASSSLRFSWYGEGSSRVSTQLAMVEMDLGLRLRVAMGERRRLVLFGGGGGSLIRLNEPVTRNTDRAQIGYWGAAGVEFPALWDIVVGVSARYAPIVDGSGTIGLELAFGFGS